MALTCAVVTTATYGATLAWDQHTGTRFLHGPYTAWQVVVLVLVLAAVTAGEAATVAPG